MVRLVSAAIPMLLAALACENPVAVSPDAARSGKWGTTGVVLEVTSKGGAIEYDCGHGTLDQPLTLDRGRFTVNGRHFREGGPTRDDDNGQPARYDGIVNGDEMALTVTLTEAKTTLGTFSLKYGYSPILSKCL